MKVKTSELIGRSLDWAVAVCQNVELDENNDPIWFDDRGWLTKYSPSTDWSQGGPIIEQLQNSSKHQFLLESDGENVHILSWPSEHVHFSGYGPTPLIAAMRCCLASKLGKEVEVPEELMESTQRSEK